MLSVVGIGPGSLDLLTERAKERISKADVIIGNERYIEQIKEIIPTDAEVITGKMGTEVERAKKAVELGRDRNVVVVSGGDAGIYGMAGIVIEVMGDSDVKLEIIPGITAASASAALLGAPLSNDFAVISLSDLLISWDEIERKLEGLAKMDITVVIYNPRSKRRKSQLEKAYEIFSRYRDGKTVVGIVRNAEREGCEVEITTLEKLPMFFHRIDMSTTLIIGCSKTENIGGRMVTRRGYEKKYDYESGAKREGEKEERTAEAIWERGKEIVRGIVSRYSFSSDYERRVAERIVFANADPSLLPFIVFKHNPVEKGVECIKDGKKVITDIEMVKAGINRKYKDKVRCYVRDSRTKEIAKRENITMTAAGIRIAKEDIHDNIIVIGNSPSACLELFSLIEKGLRPAVIIATPVGFVNAAEAKEKILSTDIPCVAIKGQRGGTPSAVAIINEMIELALGR
ncbi:MAG: precorrin-3B C(17)-methyltransferase [Candidatus Methanospirareceae archaeon]